jgi:hypothetical protein
MPFVESERRLDGDPSQNRVCPAKTSSTNRRRDRRHEASLWRRATESASHIASIVRGVGIREVQRTELDHHVIWRFSHPSATTLGSAFPFPLEQHS